MGVSCVEGSNMRLARIVGTSAVALCFIAPLAAPLVAPMAAESAVASSSVRSAALDQPMHVFDYARIVRTPGGPLSFRRESTTT